MDRYGTGILATLDGGGLPLVRQIAARIAGTLPRHVDRSELVQAGELGLVEAARRWNVDRGVPFERFAARRIHGAILDSLRSNDWAPRSVRAIARRVETSEQSLASWLGRRPTDLELAGALGITPAKLRVVRANIARSTLVAFDRLVSDGFRDGVSPTEFLADGDAPEPSQELEERELIGYLHDAISLLDDRHRRVIEGFFFDGATSAELAGALGVTESRISQVRTEAILQMRRGIAEQYGATMVEPVRSRAVKWRDDYSQAIREARRWDQRFDRPDPPMASSA
jgi:RNA polymerase sigma factor for flagellar operon FliA